MPQIVCNHNHVLSNILRGEQRSITRLGVVYIATHAANVPLNLWIVECRQKNVHLWLYLWAPIIQKD